MKKIEEGYKIYEFDLKSFFNLVNPFSVEMALRDKMAGEVVDYVGAINMNSFPKIEKLEEEEEIKIAIHKTKTSPVVLEKSGLPQGLPWSPQLCSLVLDRIGFDNENVILYADDGLIFYKDKMT